MALFPQDLETMVTSAIYAAILIAASGAGIRLAGNGEFAALGGMAVGALFIPSFSLASGVWSGSGKLFEALYTLIWYIGPLNREPALDFVGVSVGSLNAGMPAVFGILTLILIGVSYAGRRRQMAL